uniref:(northern house mosquito) hypothetical protein n=1 Tax=Culex pipiens TaxID=7175 RepID=A0A8D8IGM2_CULPI
MLVFSSPPIGFQRSRDSSASRFETRWASRLFSRSRASLLRSSIASSCFVLWRSSRTLSMSSISSTSSSSGGGASRFARDSDLASCSSSVIWRRNLRRPSRFGLLRSLHLTVRNLTPALISLSNTLWTPAFSVSKMN